MPSQGSLLLDRCTERLVALKNSPEAVAGYGAAVAALVAAVQHCPLGIPHSKGMALRWWSTTFPVSSSCGAVEQEMELRRGDYFTWQVTLEGRAGALCAMKNLLLHCRELVTDDIIGRLLTPLACAVALLTKLPALIRSYSGSVLRWSLVYRLRVYELLALLPPHTYQESFGLVMNQLVWDLSGQDHLTPPCPELLLLPPLCHQEDLQLVGSALQVKILEQFVETVNQLKGHRQQAVQTHLCAALCSLLKHQGGSRGALGPEEVRSPALSLLVGALEGLSPLLRCLAAEGLARLVQVVGDPVFTVSVSLLCFDRLKAARDAASRSGFSLALGALHRYTGGISSPQHLSTCLGVLFTLSQDSTSPEVQTWSLHSLALVVDLSGGLYRAHAEPSFTLVLRLLLAAPPTHPEVHRSLGRCLHALITCLGPDLQGEGAAVSALRSTCLVACEVMQDAPDSVVQARAISCLQQLHMFSPPHVHLASLVPALCAHLSSSSLCLRRAVGACLRQLAQLEAVEVCVHAVTLKESPRRELSPLDVTMKEVGLEGALFTLLDRESDPGLRRDLQETLVHMMASSATSGKLGHWLKLCKDVLSATADCRAPPEAKQEDEEADPARDDDSSAFRARPEAGGPFTALRWATRRFAVECVCRIIAQCETADPAHFDTALAQERRLHESTGETPPHPHRLVVGPCSPPRAPRDPAPSPSHSDFLVLHLGDLVRMAFMAATDHSEQLRLAGLQTLLLIIRRFSDIPEPEFPGHVILEQYQANVRGKPTADTRMLRCDWLQPLMMFVIAQVGAALRPAFGADAPPNVTAKACQVCSAWIASGVVSDLRDLRRVHQLLASSLAKVQLGGGRSSQLYNEAAATMETLAVLKAWAEVFLVLLVYVVAVHRSGQRQRPDCTADLSVFSPPANHSPGCGSGGAGLLKLVQSDLSTLSQLWLSALQDYGLLTLPQEYASQLPETGGSFYTAETVNQARAHYSSSWAPILHATSLWLHSTGFVVSDDTPAYLSRPATPTSMGNMGGGAKSPEDVNADRLHLILGISVQFLCSPHSDDQMENITSCLRALQALLDVPWTRAKIGTDQALGVELLLVLHRLMVTRESPGVQLSVFHLLRQIVMSSQELVRERRHSAEVDDGASEKEVQPEFGEGRDTGGLIPGRSLVVGALEMSLCVLVRKIPQICPKLAGTSPTGPGGSVWTLTDSDSQLVASALCVLSELPSLCSPEGSVSVLPTILYLLMGVFREMVLQPNTHTGAPAAGSVVVQAALQALKSVLTSPMSRQEKSRGAWTRMLRGALSSLLGLWDHDSGAGPSSLLTALTVFLLSAGLDVCTAEPLHALSLQRFRASMDAKDPLVVSRCLQLMTSLFQAPPPVAVPYIRALGPPLVRFLQKVERSRPQSPEELVGVLEGVQAMEALVQAADPSQRPRLVAVLLPLLISFLLDENALGSAPAASRSLHEAALRDLMRLGPQHSAVFRSLVSSSPALKARLEAAVRGNQESLTPKARSSPAKSSPSITLKTHFL
ncbi:HEAT repeat-containing protein 5A [Liparis tanakae]|uniref:HEAT repeat-containing protein 5A n=1 Tax=Liparis tanakae TaxID=230148 RepID=A0A4Z2JC89_9TELE|nr:HEAT repeat-containing protein 5A [Liparis tanakae]